MRHSSPPATASERTATAAGDGTVGRSATAMIDPATAAALSAATSRRAGASATVMPPTDRRARTAAVIVDAPPSRSRRRRCGRGRRGCGRRRARGRDRRRLGRPRRAPLHGAPLHGAPLDGGPFHGGPFDGRPLHRGPADGALVFRAVRGAVVAVRRRPGPLDRSEQRAVRRRVGPVAAAPPNRRPRAPPRSGVVVAAVVAAVAPAGVACGSARRRRRRRGVERSVGAAQRRGERRSVEVGPRGRGEGRHAGGERRRHRRAATPVQAVLPGDGRVGVRGGDTRRRRQGANDRDAAGHPVGLSDAAAVGAAAAERRARVARHRERDAVVGAVRGSRVGDRADRVRARRGCRGRQAARTRGARGRDAEHAAVGELGVGELVDRTVEHHGGVGVRLDTQRERRDTNARRAAGAVQPLQRGEDRGERRRPVGSADLQRHDAGPGRNARCDVAAACDQRREERPVPVPVATAVTAEVQLAGHRAVQRRDGRDTRVDQRDERTLATLARAPDGRRPGGRHAAVDAPREAGVRAVDQ